MNICSTCGMKFIRNDYYQSHLLTHTTEVPPVEPEVKVEPPKEEPAHIEEPAPVIEDKIILKFNKAVEITINGKQYYGTSIEAPNISIASEIVRIAREAYGRDILI